MDPFALFDSIVLPSDTRQPKSSALTTAASEPNPQPSHNTNPYRQPLTPPEDESLRRVMAQLDLLPVEEDPAVAPAAPAVPRVESAKEAPRRALGDLSASSQHVNRTEQSLKSAKSVPLTAHHPPKGQDQENMGATVAPSRGTGSSSSSWSRVLTPTTSSKAKTAAPQRERHAANREPPKSENAATPRRFGVSHTRTRPASPVPVSQPKPVEEKPQAAKMASDMVQTVKQVKPVAGAASAGRWASAAPLSELPFVESSSRAASVARSDLESNAPSEAPMEAYGFDGTEQQNWSRTTAWIDATSHTTNPAQVQHATDVPQVTAREEAFRRLIAMSSGSRAAVTTPPPMAEVDHHHVCPHDALPASTLPPSPPQSSSPVPPTSKGLQMSDGWNALAAMKAARSRHTSRETSPQKCTAIEIFPTPVVATPVGPTQQAVRHNEHRCLANSHPHPGGAALRSALKRDLDALLVGWSSSDPDNSGCVPASTAIRHVNDLVRNSREAWDALRHMHPLSGSEVDALLGSRVFAQADSAGGWLDYNLFSRVVSEEMNPVAEQTYQVEATHYEAHIHSVAPPTNQASADARFQQEACAGFVDADEMFVDDQDRIDNEPIFL